MAREYPYGAGVVKWVSTDWLEQHLNDENLMILDTQPDVHDYIQEHIPRAVYMNEKLLRVPKHGIPAKYIPDEAVHAVFGRVGLRPDMPVVIYTGKGAYSGQGDGLEQTMVAYSLARFGHNNVYVLDGGLDQWKVDGWPVTKEYPRVEESDFPVNVRNDYFVLHEQFREIKDRPDVLLIDNRSAGYYAGNGIWTKHGHIPGAVNLPWKKVMDRRNFCLLKPDDKIRKIVQRLGATPDKTIIVYCATGRESTNLFLLFKWYLNYPNVLNYEGSFTEWCAYPENPTVLGPDPR
jgi:thiosulfate/3-mercaptopyruvate sulfurtransferase